MLKPEIARMFAENFAGNGVRKVWRHMARPSWQELDHAQPGGPTTSSSSVTPMLINRPRLPKRAISRRKIMCPLKRKGKWPKYCDM